ncbi:MAG: hypothetical protein KDD33_13035 [Bdellovibrionales bacterium]|nr:hypothetical protein [Bdellovibrionales bacterium]
MEREEIKKVVSKVAPHLHGFKAQDEYLVHDFGYKLWFYSSWNNKTEIIGQNCTYNHKIGCSFRKEPKKIAADINRRLLKEYKADFIKRKKDKIEAQEREEQKLSLLKALAQQSGGEIEKDHGWCPGDYGLRVDGKSFSIKQHDNFYKFSLTLDFGQSLKVIQFLKEQNIIPDTHSLNNEESHN